jgi:hypothetical protein
MKRVDYRDADTFKKDILFSTKLEKFWIKVYLKQICNKYDKIEYEDYGTDNTGKVTKYATSKADYKIYLFKNKKKIIQKLDVKWGPSKGKVTFKVNSLQNYIKDGSDILLFYNIGRVSLKKPMNYKLNQHIELINQNIKNIRYTIIKTSTMKDILDKYPHEKVWYMGNKLAVTIPECDFYNFWRGKKINEF